MSISYWLDQTTTSEPRAFDVVIAGAGISGLSAAYWLQVEDPGLKIAVVERARMGFGASGRNAGFVTCGSVEHFNRMVSKHGIDEATAIWRFAEKNLTLLRENIIQDQACQFEADGCFSLATQESEMEELERVAKIMDGLRIPVEVLRALEVANATGTRGFVGGIKYKEDATVHPTQLLSLILKKLKNTTLLESTEIFNIHSTNDGTRIVKTDRGDIETSLVILALNGYSPQLNSYFLDNIYPTRGQILMLDRVPRFMRGPCYANFYLDYFRQLPSGELLIGGFRQLEKETEVGYSDHTTEKIQAALQEFVTRHLPQFSERHVTHRWAGIMGFSRDGQPLVGALPNDSQVYFFGGYTGHGMGLAFHTARCAIDLIFGRSIPNWLSAKRFG